MEPAGDEAGIGEAVVDTGADKCEGLDEYVAGEGAGAGVGIGWS